MIPPVQTFTSFDGQPIAWRALGEGPPVILIHGLFSNAETNWLRFGHAQAVADAGFRVILPDLRGHGQSAKPREAADWPHDALAKDIRALIDHLGLQPGDYDLGGYSLGSRTTIRALVNGARPRRVVLGGAGLEGLVGALGRAERFLGAIDNRDHNPPGSFEAYAVSFARSNKVDLDSARHLLLDFVALSPADLGATVTQPTLVVCGREDRDNGSAPALAAALPHADLKEIEGNHVTAVTRPGLGDAIATFLAN